MLPPRKLVVATAVLCIFQNVIAAPRTDPLVESNVGLIRGLPASDGSYSMFLGIPYAKVDKNNPFGISSPEPKFENTYEAYDDSIKCPQQFDNNDTIVGTLDCLRLNVYVPQVATSQNKVPVMVFIYGGFFHNGYAERSLYGPRYLVRHDVILVTFNYRTGPYGFMCLDIPEVPGNQGLRDQALALKWVKDNIEAFGGDSNRITVFGESAGGHSLDFHMIFGDENLFQSAIVESGSSLAATLIIDPDRAAPQKIAQFVGKNTDSINDALSFLTDADPKLVIAAMVNLNMQFKPCIERQFDGVTPFITETWVNGKKANIKGKRILVGFNEFERLEYFENIEEVSNDIFRENIQLNFNLEKKDLNEMAVLARHFYIGDENVSEDMRLPLVKFDSDYTYIYPIFRSIKRYLKSEPQTIYYYMFSYVGGRNSLNGNVEALGAKHGDELSYLFSQDAFDNMPTSPADQRVIDQMTNMWTNFAKYGDPTPETSDLLPVKWKPLTKDIFNYINISSELTVRKAPANDRMAFWDLFYLLNEKWQKLYKPKGKDSSRKKK